MLVRAKTGFGMALLGALLVATINPWSQGARCTETAFSARGLAESTPATWHDRVDGSSSATGLGKHLVMKSLAPAYPNLVAMPNARERNRLPGVTVQTAPGLASFGNKPKIAARSKAWEACRAGATMTLLAALAANVGRSVTLLTKTLLCFSAPGLEVLFYVFAACSALWFLSPRNALSARIAAQIRPLALQCAARAQHRRAAVLFAASDLGATSAILLQALVVANWAASVLPAIASRFVPLLHRQAEVMTGLVPLVFVGPWLGPMASIGGWSLNVIALLITEKAHLLCAAVLAPHMMHALLKATCPTPDIRDRSSGASGSVLSMASLLWNILRSAGAAAVLQLGLEAGRAAVGQPALPWVRTLPLAAVVASPWAWHLLARLLGLKPGTAIRGHVGGRFISGQLAGFRGLAADVTLSGPGGEGSEEGVTIGAWHARAFARRDRTLEGSAYVPAASVAGALEAVEVALSPKKKSKLIPALAAVSVGAVLYVTYPLYFGAVFILGLSAYVGRLVLPRILLIAILAVTLFSGGPLGSDPSRVVAAGLVAAFLQRYTVDQGPSALCTSLDLKSGVARIRWFGDDPGATAAAAAVSGTTAAETKSQRKRNVLSKLLPVAAFVLCFLCASFHPVTQWFEAVTHTRKSLRFVVFLAAAALTIRAMQAKLIDKGMRELPLPASVADALGGAAGVVHWFLAVNFRAALAGAAAGVCIPPNGWLQSFVYHHALVHQIHFIDAWLLQVSSGMVLAAIAVQAARLALVSLPRRPSKLPTAAACALIRGALWGGTVGVLLRIGASAVPGAAALPAAAPSASVALVSLAALAGAAPAAVRDLWARVLFLVQGGPVAGNAVWAQADAAGPVAPASLLRFEGLRAVLQAWGSQETFSVGAGTLRGMRYKDVAKIGCTVPVPDASCAASLVARLRAALRRQRTLLHRPPLSPKAEALQDGSSVLITAFVDRRATLPGAQRAMRSELLSEAAAAAALP